MITLSTHKRWRTATLFALYAAQGAPEGLLYVALPAWLAAQGEDAAAIGGYIAIILLPWSFKLINGALMDRFTLQEMGRRRPWILGAQFILVASLLTLAIGSVSSPTIALFSVVGFAINLAAAFQDVAIDGMAIDLIPESERGQANGVMWGGKTLGLATSSAVSSLLIAWSGPAAASVAIAVFVAAAMCFPLLSLERPMEQRFPWSGGVAADKKPLYPQRLGAVLSELLSAMLRPEAAVFGLAIVVAFAAYGIKTAISPVLAVKVLSWPEETFGYLASAANLVGGVFGLLLSGYLTDRVGAFRTAVSATVLMCALHGVMALAAGHWTTIGLFAGYYIAHALVFVLLSVSVYATAMSLAKPRIGATHFAAFMALLNLGTSWGAQLFGQIEGHWGYVGSFAAASLLCAGGAALLAAAAWFRTRSVLAASEA